jgi:hypothetical protein
VFFVRRSAAGIAFAELVWLTIIYRLGERIDPVSSYYGAVIIGAVKVSHGARRS